MPEPERETVPQSPVVRATPATTAPAAGPRAFVLGLQRQIGNRATAKLMRETDPRLTYTAEAKAEAKGLDAQPLPWTTPGSQSDGWNAGEILSKLTQIDDNTLTTTDEKRCGANAVLALAIIRGPFDTERFARGIMLKALGRSTDAAESADGRKTMGGIYTDIWPSIRRIGNATATYGDLSWVAHYAKMVMSKNPDGWTTGHEVGAMAGLMGGMRASAEPILDRKHIYQLTASLDPGKAMILNVGTSVVAHDDKYRGIKAVNHFVVLGKGKGGKLYLYDPYPRIGKQVFTDAEAGFWTLFENQEGDWKSSYVFLRPTS